MRRRCSCFPLLALAAALGIGCGRVDPSDSETHFLSTCTDDCTEADCGAAPSQHELSCIDGVVTRQCENTSDCTSLDPNAICSTSSSLTVCDVVCASAGDCASLGRYYACENGLCRSRPRGATVGQPCIPTDELHPDFSSFGVTEVNISDQDDTCAGPDICLLNHFQGRVTCPYGQTSDQALADPRCFASGPGDPVRVAVEPQLLERRPVDAVYCSCRCDAPSSSAELCTCPTGFTCTPLIEQTAVPNDYAGSYCVKDGTIFSGVVSGDTCDPAFANCP